MELELNNGLMVQNMKDNMPEVRNMEKESLIGQMDPVMMVNS